MNLCCDVIHALEGKTLVTAESCTGGGIGAALTAVSGSSAVFKGGIISYTNEVKNAVLGVDAKLLKEKGAVSAPVAEAMAKGARARLEADIAVSVTGLAGPGGDDYGNPVGTVYIGIAREEMTEVRHYCFAGNRDQVRAQAVRSALEWLLQLATEE